MLPAFPGFPGFTLFLTTVLTAVRRLRVVMPWPGNYQNQRVSAVRPLILEETRSAALSGSLWPSPAEIGLRPASGSIGFRKPFVRYIAKGRLEVNLSRLPKNFKKFPVSSFFCPMLYLCPRKPPPSRLPLSRFSCSLRSSSGMPSPSRSSAPPRSCRAARARSTTCWPPASSMPFDLAAPRRPESGSQWSPCSTSSAAAAAKTIAVRPRRQFWRVPMPSADQVRLWSKHGRPHSSNAGQGELNGFF